MSKKAPVKFGLVGIGGYGANYVNVILELEKEGLGTFGAAVVRTAGKYPKQEQILAERNVPVVKTLEEMLALDCYDIAAIPTGIDAHRDQMIKSVEAGFNVICEKPTAATIQDFDAMADALKRTGKWCQIGFQSQSIASVKTLKREICEGRLGKIREVIVTGCWQRDDLYYSRNAWAGKIKRDDQWILDGAVNNPMAHYLFNGLYFASTDPAGVAMPASVRAELYHAHEIESEDTACLQAQCDNGTVLYFYGTLAASGNADMQIEVIGEKGRATWNSSQIVRFYKGEELVSELPAFVFDGVEHWRNLIRRYHSGKERLNCPLEITRAHVLAVNGAFMSNGMPRQIPDSAMDITAESEPKPRVLTVIRNIEDTIAKAATERKLFSDMDIPWAVATKAVDVRGLKEFDMPQ